MTLAGLSDLTCSQIYFNKTNQTSMLNELSSAPEAQVCTLSHHFSDACIPTEARNKSTLVFLSLSPSLSLKTDPFTQRARLKKTLREKSTCKTQNYNKHMKNQALFITRQNHTVKRMSIGYMTTRVAGTIQNSRCVHALI